MTAFGYHIKSKRDVVSDVADKKCLRFSQVSVRDGTTCDMHDVSLHLLKLRVQTEHDRNQLISFSAAAFEVNMHLYCKRFDYRKVNCILTEICKHYL